MVLVVSTKQIAVTLFDLKLVDNISLSFVNDITFKVFVLKNYFALKHKNIHEDVIPSPSMVTE